MHQLLLLRHAKSLWDDPKLSDHARPLNIRGRTAARAMRTAMHERGLRPDLVLVSSARRTLQTLEALGPWDTAPRVEPMDALYLASARSMLDVLHEVTEAVRSVLLIGHNPGMHELAMMLAGGAAMPARLAEGYPTAALAIFTVPPPWQTLAPQAGRLEEFLAPSELPDPAP